MFQRSSAWYACVMSVVTRMPPLGDPPVRGRVAKVHRMPGHYVKEGEPVLDVRVGLHIVTLCSPEAGKVMRARDVGEAIGFGEMAFEVTGVGTPTWEVFIAYRWKDSPGHAGRLGERLIAAFGAGQVFKDVEALPPGL